MLICVPVNNDGGGEVEPCHAVMLALRSTVADFTLASDPQRVFQGVMGFTFVQSYLGPALHIGIEQPFNDEQRPFDPSDFTQSDG